MTSFREMNRRSLNSIMSNQNYCAARLFTASILVAMNVHDVIDVDIQNISPVQAFINVVSWACRWWLRLVIVAVHQLIWGPFDYKRMDWLMKRQIAWHRFSNFFLLSRGKLKSISARNFSTYRMHHNVVFTIQQSRSGILMKRLDIILSRRCRWITLVGINAWIIGACVNPLNIQHRASWCNWRSLCWYNMPLNQLICRWIGPEMILSLSSRVI